MRPYITTIALAMLAIFAGLVTGASIFVLLIPFIAASLVYNFIAVLQGHKHKRLRLVRIAICVIVPAVVGAAHWYWFASSRATANEAISAIIKHRERTGSWPVDLAETGVSEHVLRDGRMGYLFRNEEPFFVYPSTFEVFDSYTYNFHANQWEYNRD